MDLAVGEVLEVREVGGDHIELIQVEAITFGGGSRFPNDGFVVERGGDDGGVGIERVEGGGDGEVDCRFGVGERFDFGFGLGEFGLERGFGNGIFREIGKIHADEKDIDGAEGGGGEGCYGGYLNLPVIIRRQP